ncbi:MAG: hypothetical protein JWO38_5034 [Gemmataceae bacterium]|nr:hypothetical protein [Gemmataceae bacterium]
MNSLEEIGRPTLSTDGTAGPYIIVGRDQLELVRHELLAAHIPHDVDEDAVRLNGKPALAVINLGYDPDLSKVRSLLDRVTAALNSRRPRHRPPVERELELVIQVDPKEMGQLTRRLEADLPGGWGRRRDLEERMKQALSREPVVYCFFKQVPPTGREVAVWLQARGRGELYISSVLPLQTREPFGVDLYNAALRDFQKTLIEPVSKGLNARALDYPSPDEPSLEDLLSAEALHRLRAFNATANKTSLHPLDLQRWHAFITKAHRDNAAISSDALASWLEDEGWPEPTRKQLVDTYETARAVLSAYDDELIAR